MLQVVWKKLIHPTSLTPRSLTICEMEEMEGFILSGTEKDNFTKKAIGLKESEEALFFSYETAGDVEVANSLVSHRHKLQGRAEKQNCREPHSTPPWVNISSKITLIQY